MHGFKNGISFSRRLQWIQISPFPSIRTRQESFMDRLKLCAKLLYEGNKDEYIQIHYLC